MDLQTIIAVGVTGVGKSTLLSILSDDPNVFPHGTTQTAFTQECKTHTIAARPGLHDFSVDLTDAPGSANLSVDGKHAEMDEKMHKEASKSIKENERQTFLYVVTPTIAGGVDNQDISAYGTLSRCYGAKPYSIVGVINCDPYEPDDLMSRQLLLKTLADHKIEVAEWKFVKQMNLDSPSSYNSSEVQEVRKSLWSSLTKLRAEQHKIKAERETAERLAAEREKAEQDRKEQEKKQQLEKVVEETKMLALQAEQKRQADEFAAEQKRQAAVRAEQKATADRKAAELTLQLQKKEQERRAKFITVKCDEGTGNPCTRCNSTQWTVGYLEDRGNVRPYWNCKWLGHKHHDPWCKGH